MTGRGIPGTSLAAASDACSLLAFFRWRPALANDVSIDDTPPVMAMVIDDDDDGDDLAMLWARRRVSGTLASDNNDGNNGIYTYQ